jgi:hypothetical protein
MQKRAIKTPMTILIVVRMQGFPTPPGRNHFGRQASQLSGKWAGFSLNAAGGQNVPGLPREMIDAVCEIKYNSVVEPSIRRTEL